MSNLGGYQVLTTVAKKVHGPGKLVLLLIGGGVVIGVGATKGGEKLTAAIKKASTLRNNKYGIDHFFTVHMDATDKAQLTLHKGDTFRVLESDGDAILIEISGNDNNPYFVSGNWLESISDFKRI